MNQLHFAKSSASFAWAFVCAALLISLPAFAAAPAKPCKILVMGDSLSAAYGLPVEQGWVALMDTRVKEKFPACKIVNASVSGETTAGGKTRLPALLETHKPSHMILELGANDGLRGLSVEAMKDNLNHMLMAARSKQTEVVMLGMKIPPNYGPMYTRRFEQTFAEIAQKQKVVLVPFFLNEFAQNPKAFQSDGIHPNAASQHFMLNAVWPAVSATLETHILR